LGGGGVGSKLNRQNLGAYEVSGIVEEESE
jgi:hypothetical protein